MYEAISRSTVHDGRAPQESAFSRRLLPLVIATALLVVGLDLLDGKAYLIDVDDTLRAIEIRQFLSSGHWYDLTLPMIRMPEPYVSAWSRVVDFPYIAIAWLLSSVVEQERAVQWSFNAWPPAMLIVCCLLIFRILRGLQLDRLTINTHLAILVPLSMAGAILEFSPGRIDHHNVQILLLMAMLVGVVQWTRRGGILIGVTAALSIAVGLECTPLIVVLLGGIVVAWVLGAEGSDRMLCSSMISTSVATPIAALAFIGPTGFMSTQCDAFSAPYIYIAAALSLAAGLAALAIRPDASVWKKLFVLSAPGLLILLGFGSLFSACLTGPYNIIDPVSRHFWFDRIPQEQSFLFFFLDAKPVPIIDLAVEIIIAFLAFPYVMKQVRHGRSQEAIVFAVALSSIVCSLVLTRYVSFSAAFVPLLLPIATTWMLRLLEGPNGFWAGTRALILAIAPIMTVTLVAYLTTPIQPRAMDTIDVMAVDRCLEDGSDILSRIPSGLVVAPTGLALAIAERAPPGLSVAGIPFHRASPGLRRTFLAFTSSDGAVRREALAPFDYVAVCHVPIQVDAAQAPLYSALAADRGWPGLVRIGGVDQGTRLRLFRIDHGRLQ